MTRRSDPYIDIELASQRLQLLDNAKVVFTAAVSTARNGAGERNGSECTPRGWHVIRARIGAGSPVDTVFAGRRPTGEIYTAELGARFPGRDWILTRILWLSGLEPGRNRLGDVDTMRRYIYIHGSPDATRMGVPASHGCVRMHNADVIALFDRVKAGTRVLIRP
ncbi:MAG: ErfK/YbiS/YcfS/YnhG family protein [Gammaproteobacteria bacterium]|nr:MAG: ErfK/YbiS/YcfS/YnhG family protein [Gammaproteobacteria bacterium]TND07011.1 MAG: ErfK/YbiS/YcfS/YnhG family protein [Gammaproteobacteria bacterium]